MKKPTTSQKRKVLKFIEQMQWMFSINQHEQVISFKSTQKDGSPYLAADIIHRTDYQEVEINVYPCFWSETEDKQRKILLHELCHIPLMESSSIAYSLSDGTFVPNWRIKEVNEEATSKVENIIDKLLRGKLKYATKAYAGYLSKPKKKVRRKLVKKKRSKKPKK